MPNAKSKIFGIDPGPVFSAYCILENYNILDKGIVPNADMLNIINIWKDKRPFIAIEFLQCYGMAVGKEVFTTCFWSGRFAERAEQFCLDFNLYARPTIKSFITGSARANDSLVRQSLLLRYGGTKKGEPLHGVKRDIWSALAVSTYVADGAKLGAW